MFVPTNACTASKLEAIINGKRWLAALLIFDQLQGR